ncbi:MAG: fused MFS/spermidine synthase [Nannocystaceae bacterium]
MPPMPAMPPVPRQPPLFDGAPWPRRHFLTSMAGGLVASSWANFAQASPRERVLEEAQSEYSRIQVTERGSVRTLYFVVDGVRYIESRWDMSHPHSLDLDYARTMMAGFLLHPAPRRMMMMGLGGGQITNYLFERFPDLEIDAVDIDPEVVRLARKYFGVPQHPRYRTHVDDGRLFIEKSSKRWDLMMLDAFRGAFVPFHLKTREFYRACLTHLSSDGVVVANLHNMTTMYPHDRNTLAAVFPHRYSFVSEAGNQTTFVASASSRRIGTFEIRAHAATVAPHLEFDVMGLAARYYMRRDWEVDAQVLSDDFAASELRKAAQRHNQTCVFGCRYQTRE